MKILIWSQYFWPENFHINEVATALVEEGHEVTVLTGKPNYPGGVIFPGYRAGGTSQETFHGVTVRRIPLLPRQKGAFRLALNYLSFIASGYVHSGKALSDRQFDVVFAYAPSPLLQVLPAIRFARRAAIPLALWVQDLWPEALEATGFVRNKFLLGLVEGIVRRIYAKSDVILAQSEAFVERLTPYVDDPQKIIFFPNSVDERQLGHPGSLAANELANAMRACFAVTFTGNIGQAQSAETIVEAAEALRHVEAVRFFIVGAGSRADWIANEAKRRGLSNIVLPGRYPKEDMSVIMQASSILLLTLGSGVVGSYTVPSKLQAYLAMGKPIIASADGEAARVIMDSRSGFACRAEDGGALASAILQMHGLSSSEREEMGRNGQLYLTRHYSLSHLIKRLADILEDSRRKFRSSRT